MTPCLSRSLSNSILKLIGKTPEKSPIDFYFTKLIHLSATIQEKQKISVKCKTARTEQKFATFRPINDTTMQKQNESSGHFGPYRYRYYSPEFKKGKLKIIKGGINNLKTLYERRETVKKLLKIEKDLLESKVIIQYLTK